MKTVYKSGGNENDYLITLEINPYNSNTNLSRKVDNELTAKYRCRRAFVKSIEHKETGVHVDSIRSKYNPSFIYYVGKEVEEPNYDNDIDNVCTSGIHFFKTKEPALFWKWTPKNGPYKEWYENGQLLEEIEYKNGKREGLYKGWYENGLLGEEGMYRNGKQEGPYKCWYKNGQIMLECEYKNGEREGQFKRWHENGGGELWEEIEYKNGKREGLYKCWHESGQIIYIYKYKDGKRIYTLNK